MESKRLREIKGQLDTAHWWFVGSAAGAVALNAYCVPTWQLVPYAFTLGLLSFWVWLKTLSKPTQAWCSFLCFNGSMLGRTIMPHPVRHPNILFFQCMMLAFSVWMLTTLLLRPRIEAIVQRQLTPTDTAE